MTNPDDERIERLIPQLCKAHHMLARTLFGELGLYRGQPLVLEYLWEQDGRTQTELAEALHVQPATVTKMIQRMEQAGFLRRQTDMDDQRALRVYATQQAYEIKPEVVKIFEQMEKVVLRGFTLEEKVLLRRFLLQIRDNLRAAQ